MPTLLHLDASPRGDYSISRQLSAAAVAAWKDKHPGGKVIVRDLTKTKMTFVDLDWITGAFSAPDQLTDDHKSALAISDTLISELLEADEIVMGTPMYNFTVPAVVKAWIDHVVRAGKTFNYGSSGPEGLAKGRKMLVTVASGGSYDKGSGMEAYNYETPYLRQILGFIGITDLTFVHAGGTMRVVQGQISAEEFLAPLLKQIRATV
ncbi:MAG TPA: FMN-dependent NADH-azoreductase [Chthoniobacterales bacterium]